MRKDEVWQNRTGSYIETIKPTGYDVLINGTDKYLNFNTVSGTLGYGFRDNAGVMEYKNSGGGWNALPSGGISTMVIGATITGATEGSVLFAGAGGVLAQDNANFFWNNTTKQLTLSGSLTGSQATSALSIAQTWNTSGAPTALLMNITDTASQATSKLFDFQTGSVSKLSITKGGLLQFGNTGTIGVQSSSTNPVIYEGTNVTGMTSGNGDLMLSGRQGFGIGFQTSTSGATDY